MQRESLTSELHQVLQDLELDASLASKEITSRITSAVCRWARSNGWSPEVEYAVPGYRRRGDRPLRGMIDVRLTKPWHRSVAIEIDRRNNRKSLDKLSHCVRLGDRAVWIRWMRPDGFCIAVPPEIQVVPLHL